AQDPRGRRDVGKRRRQPRGRHRLDLAVAVEQAEVAAADVGRRRHRRIAPGPPGNRALEIGGGDEQPLAALHEGGVEDDRRPSPRHRLRAPPRQREPPAVHAEAWMPPPVAATSTTGRPVRARVSWNSGVFGSCQAGAGASAVRKKLSARADRPTTVKYARTTSSTGTRKRSKKNFTAP